MRTKGQIRVLMTMTYKGYPIIVRQIGTDLYMWDTVFNNEFYGSYIVMKPSKNRLKLKPDELEEVVKMCYAGAAATLDNKLGIEVTDEEQAVVARFEAARSQFEGKTN